MTNTKNEPKKVRVLNYLQNGNSLTKQSAKTRFNVGNIRATVSDIRKDLGKNSKKLITGKNKVGVLSYSWKQGK